MDKFECICGRDFETERGLNVHKNSCEFCTTKDPRNDVTVACCVWGDWCGNHKINYVNKLFRATNKHLTIPHRFVCFTDTYSGGFDEGIELKPLSVPSMVGILPKLILYDPNNGLTGRVLGMDLDKVILGNIDEFILCNEPFVVRSMFKWPEKIGGGMVSFDAGAFGELIWEPLCERTKEIEKITEGGDERLAYAHLLAETNIPITFWQDLFPGRILSYKVDMRRHRIEAPPEGASIISFHGTPRPHNLKNIDWVRENWHEL